MVPPPKKPRFSSNLLVYAVLYVYFEQTWVDSKISGLNSSLNSSLNTSLIDPWIQDPRFSVNFSWIHPRNLGSRSKIQDPRFSVNFSWIHPRNRIHGENPQKNKKHWENQQKTIFGDSLGKLHWQNQKNLEKTKKPKNQNFSENVWSEAHVWFFLVLPSFFCFFWSWPGKN